MKILKLYVGVFIASLIVIGILMAKIRYEIIEIEKKKSQVVIPVFIKNDIPESAYYNTAILEIMLKEDFQSTPYIGVDGRYYIGFGHQIQKNEKFNAPISFLKAFKTLQSDFGYWISEAEKSGYNGHEKISVGHFFYTTGKRKIRDLPNDFFKYIYINKKKSLYLQKRREFEKQIYKGIINPINSL